MQTSFTLLNTTLLQPGSRRLCCITTARAATKNPLLRETSHGQFHPRCFSKSTTISTSTSATPSRTFSGSAKTSDATVDKIARRKQMMRNKPAPPVASTPQTSKGTGTNTSTNANALNTSTTVTSVATNTSASATSFQSSPSFKPSNGILYFTVFSLVGATGGYYYYSTTNNNKRSSIYNTTKDNSTLSNPSAADDLASKLGGILNDNNEGGGGGGGPNNKNKDKSENIESNQSGPGNFSISSLLSESEIPNPFSMIYNYIYKNMYEPYVKPSRDKLLPDWHTIPNIPPHMPELPTLVLDLEDTLVQATWTSKYGWRYAKRPGLDEFLMALGPHYEIVLFTPTSHQQIEEVTRTIDKHGAILHRLYKTETLFDEKTGKYIKDLSNLNRDLKRAIIVDDDPHAFSLQPDNAILVPKYDKRNAKTDDTLPRLKKLLLALVTEDARDFPATLNSLHSSAAYRKSVKQSMSINMDDDNENTNANQNQRQKEEENLIYSYDLVEEYEKRLIEHKAQQMEKINSGRFRQVSNGLFGGKFGEKFTGNSVRSSLIDTEENEQHVVTIADLKSGKVTTNPDKSSGGGGSTNIDGTLSTPGEIKKGGLIKWYLNHKKNEEEDMQRRQEIMQKKMMQREQEKQQGAAFQ